VNPSYEEDDVARNEPGGSTLKVSCIRLIMPGSILGGLTLMLTFNSKFI
jgi:hypothetical protein